MTFNSMKDRVVAITGAGRGLGRAYALLMAEQGASVVVNDLGVAADGHGKDYAVASSVVAEIQAKGGRAVADTSDVTLPEGGQAIVDQALSSFGRLDAVVNNAGIVGYIPFPETTLDLFEHYWRIHLGGSYNVTKAAWPIFAKQNYGRIVLTGSGGGLYGIEAHAPYAAAKGAIQGLARVLALEGVHHGILTNVITPGGYSRMHETSQLEPAQLEWAKSFQPPELVAPAVAWLASDQCHENGQTFVAWAGRVARVAVGAGRGLIDRELTVEKIIEHHDAIMALDGFYEPTDVLDEVHKWVGECTPDVTP